MIRELRIIVAGSREFKNYDLLRDTLMDYLDFMDDNFKITFVITF